MMSKPDYIKFNTGKESAIAFLNEPILRKFCEESGYTLPNVLEWGKQIQDKTGAEVGYITKPGYGITLKDPDYQWIIVWT